MLLDALDKALTCGGTTQVVDSSGNVQGISELFQGQLNDYIECLSCKYRRVRPEYFRDISVSTFLVIFMFDEFNFV